jgi:hypothetical protein
MSATKVRLSGVLMGALVVGTACLAYWMGSRTQPLVDAAPSATPSKRAQPGTDAQALASWRAQYPIPTEFSSVELQPRARSQDSLDRARPPQTASSRQPRAIAEPLLPDRVPVLVAMWDLPSTLRPARAASTAPLTPPDWRIVGTVERADGAAALVMRDDEPGIREVKVGTALPGGAELRWISQGVLGIALADGRRGRLTAAGDRPPAAQAPVAPGSSPRVAPR